MARKRGFILGPIIYRMVRDLAPEHDGLVDDSLMRLQIADWLDKHPDYLLPSIKQASRLWNQYKKIVRPKPRSPGGFYHPQRLIPAAPTQSCVMQSVTLAQLDFWEAHDENAFRNAEEAHQGKRDYWGSRKRAFADTGLPDLNEVEVHVFGFKPSLAPTMPEEVLDDEDDDEE